MYKIKIRLGRCVRCVLAQLIGHGSGLCFQHAPSIHLEAKLLWGGCCEILAGEKWIIDKIFLKVHQEKQDIYVQFESPK